MAENKIDGFKIFKPHEKAPTFVKGSISITRSAFIDWLNAQEVDDNDRLRLELKQGSDGGLYCSLNTYKKS